MKPIIIVLVTVAAGSLVYGLYQRNEVGSLRTKLEAAERRALVAEADAMRLRDIAEQNRLAAEKAAEEARMAMMLAQQQAAESRKRRR
ncbi:MAG: hypothetical protein JNN04_08810 [Cyclobacteriaceae bacterium]|nr:hypothetical protein [Cyclobacteriaceae bacterium]